MKALLVLVLALRLARAEERPTVAVIDVVAKDAESAKAATAITAALRARTTGKGSDYRAKGTPKEIVAAVAAAACKVTEPRCGATIGAALAVDLAIVGELERRGARQVLVLSLVEVRTKSRARSVRQVAAASADAAKLGRSAYDRLTGEVGELAITTNAEHGEVQIDGVVVGALFEGHATIDGLVKGAHLLAIRAPGFKPFEVEVTIDAATRQTLLLEPQ